MRIVQAVSGLGWVGGVQEYVAGLSRGLRDEGHEVVILAGGRPPPDGPELHPLADGLDVRFHPKRRVAKRYLYPTGLRASLHEFSKWADVVHVHQPFFVGTWLAAATRLPLAATLYLHPEHITRFRRRQQLKVLIRRLDLLVGVSQAEVDLILSVARPRRSGVVWPALTVRPRLVDKTRERPTAIYVGRLTWSKNLDTLIRAFALLPQEVDRLIVGGGPDAGDVEALCVALGMDDSVVVNDVSDLEIDDALTRATVFVSVSQEESFGIASMRALAHGCRTVLSDIPSHREIATSLGAGDEYLVDTRAEPAELAAAIESAVRAPALPFEVAARVPTWHEAAVATADLYDRMLRSRRSR